MRHIWGGGEVMEKISFGYSQHNRQHRESGEKKPENDIKTVVKEPGSEDIN
jgi:hypothetical protein